MGKKNQPGCCGCGETPPPTGCYAQVYVVGCGGQPLANAHVEVFASDDLGTPIASGETGSTGTFNFTIPAEASYSIQVSHPRFVSWSGTETISCATDPVHPRLIVVGLDIAEGYHCGLCAEPYPDHMVGTWKYGTFSLDWTDSPPHPFSWGEGWYGVTTIDFPGFDYGPGLASCDPKSGVKAWFLFSGTALTWTYLGTFCPVSGGDYDSDIESGYPFYSWGNSSCYPGCLTYYWGPDNPSLPYIYT